MYLQGSDGLSLAYFGGICSYVWQLLLSAATQITHVWVSGTVYHMQNATA